MAERLNAAVSKTVLPLIEVTRVQIPPLPPVDAGSLRGAFLIPRDIDVHAWIDVLQ